MKSNINLKNIREALGITQQELAFTLEIEASNISKYESNPDSIPLEVVINLSRVLNLSVDDLLNLEKEKGHPLEVKEEWLQPLHTAQNALEEVLKRYSFLQEARGIFGPPNCSHLVKYPSLTFEKDLEHPTRNKMPFALAQVATRFHQHLDDLHLPLITMVGMINSGKSTIINTLLGEDILPSHIKETTAVPIFVCSASFKGDFLPEGHDFMVIKSRLSGNRRWENYVAMSHFQHGTFDSAWCMITEKAAELKKYVTYEGEYFQKYKDSREMGAVVLFLDEEKYPLMRHCCLLDLPGLGRGALSEKNLPSVPENLEDVLKNGEIDHDDLGSMGTSLGDTGTLLGSLGVVAGAAVAPVIGVASVALGTGLMASLLIPSILASKEIESKKEQKIPHKTRSIPKKKSLLPTYYKTLLTLSDLVCYVSPDFKFLQASGEWKMVKTLVSREWNEEMEKFCFIRTFASSDGKEPHLFAPKVQMKSSITPEYYLDMESRLFSLPFSSKKPEYNEKLYEYLSSYLEHYPKYSRGKGREFISSRFTPMVKKIGENYLAEKQRTTSESKEQSREAFALFDKGKEYLLKELNEIFLRGYGNERMNGFSASIQETLTTSVYYFDEFLTSYQVLQDGCNLENLQEVLFDLEVDFMKRLSGDIIEKEQEIFLEIEARLDEFSKKIKEMDVNGCFPKQLGDIKEVFYGNFQDDDLQRTREEKKMFVSSIHSHAPLRFFWKREQQDSLPREWKSSFPSVVDNYKMTANFGSPVAKRLKKIMNSDEFQENINAMIDRRQVFQYNLFIKRNRRLYDFLIKMEQEMRICLDENIPFSALDEDWSPYEDEVRSFIKEIRIPSRDSAYSMYFDMEAEGDAFCLVFCKYALVMVDLLKVFSVCTLLEWYQCFHPEESLSLKELKELLEEVTKKYEEVPFVLVGDLIVAKEYMEEKQAVPLEEILKEQWENPPHPPETEELLFGYNKILEILHGVYEDNQ